VNFLYLDIETIPAQSPEAQAAVAATVKHPATMKKADTIAAWEANDKAQAVSDAIAKTSLDGTYGHIHTIGFALNEGEVDCQYLPDLYSSELEAEALRAFFAKVDAFGVSNPYPLCIVGHNLVGFDIRFIWQRAIILGVRVPQWFPRDPKPWSNEVFDTMTAFAGQRNTIGLDRLCQALGLNGKGDVDGSMVASLWEARRSDDIARYCMEDIERTRAVHRRMSVAFGDRAA